MTGAELLLKLYGSLLLFLSTVAADVSGEPSMMPFTMLTR